MPGYRSNPGGLFNSGVQPSSRPQVDLGGLLEAVGAGTGSIIHSVMARRMAENQIATQQQELDLRKQEAQRASEHETWQRGFEEKKLAQTAEQQRNQNMINGLVTTPATPATDITYQAPITPLNAPPSKPQSPIARAAATRGMPGPQIAPAAAPSAPPMTATVHDPQVAQPERAGYDPDRDRARIRAVDVANIRGGTAETVADTRARSAEAVAGTRAQSAKDVEAQRQAGRLAAVTRAGELAKDRQRIANEAKGAGAIPRAMTQAQKDKVAVDDASGFLSAYAGGTYDDALDTFRNTPQGKALQESGVTEDHLLRAYGKMKRDPDTGRIIGLIQSGAVVESQKGAGDQAQVAAKVVDDAKKAGRPPRFRAQPPESGAPKSGATAPKADSGTKAPPVQPGPTAAAAATNDARAKAIAWQKKNPQNKGEKDEDYYARYKKGNP